MGRMGKRHSAALQNIDRNQLYELTEACSLVKNSAYAGFDESVDVAVRLGVNPKYADQMVRGSVALPNGTGKQVKVIVFAKGEKVHEAEAAGADEAGAEDLVEKVKGGWLDFDKAVSTPDMMGKVGPLGRLLGPRGLMPNPKAGTVTFDVGAAVKELKAGRIEFRVDKAGIVHCPVGRVSFEPDKLAENVTMLMDKLIRMRPASAKGTYVKSVALSSTMGPGIKLNPQQFVLQS